MAESQAASHCRVLAAGQPWRSHSFTLADYQGATRALHEELLTVLAQRRGRVQSREQLLRDVWEYNSLIDTRTVDTHMRRLREKLGPGAKYLDTVRGKKPQFAHWLDYVPALARG